MILVDASIMIDFLRTPDPRMRNLLNQHQGAICGITKAEVLHGARDANHFQSLAKKLAAFVVVPVPDKTWDSLGYHLFLLRINGVSVPFADAIIATLAIESNVELWARDVHFALIKGVLPSLRLFQEPP
jgi:predicted nucleic acid-binding protein